MATRWKYEVDAIPMLMLQESTASNRRVNIFISDAIFNSFLSKYDAISHDTFSYVSGPVDTFLRLLVDRRTECLLQ